MTDESRSGVAVTPGLCQLTVKGHRQDLAAQDPGGAARTEYWQQTHWPASSIQVVSTTQHQTTALSVSSNLVVQPIDHQVTID